MDMSGMGSGSMSGMGSDSMSGMGSGSMSGMGSMGDMSCMTSMTGNWQTVGICILSPSWHIKTHAEFAGSCVGIFMMVVLIEVVRRFGREWDRYIVRSGVQQRLAQNLDAAPPAQTEIRLSPVSSDGGEKRGASPAEPDLETAMYGYRDRTGVHGPAARFWARNPRRLRPSLLQQAVRSLIYAIQFTGAYLVMLIAMTFNGYIIMVICLGGLFGHFISTWDALALTFTSDVDPLYPAARGERDLARLEVREGIDRIQVQDVGSNEDSHVAAGRAADATYGHGTCC